MATKCFAPNCPTSSTTALKTCSSCRVAAYCGETCQRGNWQEHKQWCRPRTESAACWRCQEFPDHTLTLHSNEAMITPEQMREKYATLTFMTSKTVVCVLHAPFTAVGQSVLRAAAPPGADTASLDTIFFANSGVHVGRWDANFGRGRLALTFSRQDEKCSVCHTGTLGFLCGECKTPTCKACARDLISMDVFDSSRGGVPVQMFPCPRCREKVYLI